MALTETANVGKAVAARVGTNIREVRTKLGLTQAQLATPEFSISYISAIERGKIRPSLKALSILAKRLDVPLTFLLEGSPAGAAEARAVGYSAADSGPDQKIDVDLLQAGVLVQQHIYAQAAELLTPIQPDRITTDQAYRLFFLRGQIHLGMQEYQQAVVDLRAAVAQGEGLNDVEYIERARNLLGKAYFLLYNYTLAMKNHLRCYNAIEIGQIIDLVFTFDAYNNLANDYFRHSKHEKAITFYTRALQTLEGVSRDAKSFAARYMDVGRNYKNLGKLTVARDYILRSLAIYEMCDEQRLEELSHQDLGKTLEKQNDLDGAVTSSIYPTNLAELLLKGGNLQGAEPRQVLEFTNEGNDAQIRSQADNFVGSGELFEQVPSHSRRQADSAYFRFANVLEDRNEVQRGLNAIKGTYEHQRLGNRDETKVRRGLQFASDSNNAPQRSQKGQAAFSLSTDSRFNQGSERELQRTAPYGIIHIARRLDCCSHST